ncbi:extracellular solute-binding protein [Candidatus Nomurabacteria bacterium]|nr:extracellular solute-binding protein [Candidatus Nomurabacteria bacterium]
MNKISPLQLILLVVAGFAIVVAVIIFAFNRSNSGSTEAEVVMWGTFSPDLMINIGRTLQQSNVDISNIVYIQKDPNTIEDEFVSALAEGEGPDLIILNQDQIISNYNRVIKIPYETFALRDYLNTFISEGDLFASDNGIVAVPLFIDPMVMYWNKSLFSAAGISSPPKYWSEVMGIAPRLTNSDSNLIVSQSAVALGEFRNINHAKEIFLNLILQAGNNVVIPNTDENVRGSYKVILDERLGYTVIPTVAAMNFFTQFSNPTKDVYSWNRSLPNSLDRFIGGDLAMYFGFVSEQNTIRQKNPNLDFDVSTMPQSQNASEPKVFGRMSAIAISRNSQNPQGAFNAILKLTSQLVQNQIKIETGLPPVRRDLLQADPNDPFESIFFTSALWSKGVREVDAQKTTEILQSMVESYVTGRSDAGEAVTKAQTEMELLLDQ